MSEIFSPAQRYELWLRIELIVTEGWAEIGEIPRPAVVRRRAIEERATLMAGRTHGIHAEPVSFGFILAGWLDELDRERQRIVTAREDVRVGKLSGAVGTHATVDPRVEEMALAKLGLKVAPVTTQVIARDHHAAYLTTLAVVAGS